MRLVALSVVSVLAVACTGGAGSGASPTPFVAPTDTPYNGPARGAWSGTITVRGVIDVNKSENGSSGDTGSVYYETYTKNDVTQTDVTDTFTISANDPDDLTYGIHQVDLGGSAANAGTTLERYLTTWQKGNSGCTWTEEDGTETKGSWSENGDAVGSMRFSEDGSYSIDIHANTALSNGEQPDGPKLPYRNWQAVTNLTAGCTGNGYDTTTTQGPGIEWASSFLGTADKNGVYSRIDGQLNASNPGSVVDGSVTWELSEQDITLTITWHLVHEGPIVVPHA
jgi:hypothetical protein